jgi:hypothetical protein
MAPCTSRLYCRCFGNHYSLHLQVNFTVQNKVVLSTLRTFSLPRSSSIGLLSRVKLVCFANASEILTLFIFTHRPTSLWKLRQYACPKRRKYILCVHGATAKKTWSTWIYAFRNSRHFIMLSDRLFLVCLLLYIDTSIQFIHSHFLLTSIRVSLLVRAKVPLP